MNFSISKKELYLASPEGRKLKSLKAKRIATRGEQIAADFLKRNSYTLLARNYRAGRSGEIDIVALSPEEVLVFVEVKTRSITEPTYGIPELGFEAVGYTKQKRLLAASRKFMEVADFTSIRWRYDVIVIGIAAADNRKTELTHVVDAFSQNLN